MVSQKAALRSAVALLATHYHAYTKSPTHDDSSAVAAATIINLLYMLEIVNVHTLAAPSALGNIPPAQYVANLMEWASP